jgi:hypothetical protein
MGKVSSGIKCVAKQQKIKSWVENVERVYFNFGEIWIFWKKVKILKVSNYFFNFYSSKIQISSLSQYHNLKFPSNSNNLTKYPNTQYTMEKYYSWKIIS